MKYILIIIFIGTLIIGPNVYRWNNLRIEYNLTSEEKNLLEQETNSLMLEIEKRENDLEYIRELAYRDFQMVGDGEKIYRVKDTKQIEY